MFETKSGRSRAPGHLPSPLPPKVQRRTGYRCDASKLCLVKTIYKNATICIEINGFLSNKIKLEKGVRQGCPLSSLLYVLVVEILASQLRNNSEIIGFKLRSEEIVSSHYADYVVINILNNKVFKEVWWEIHLFESATGAKFNIKKTSGLWVGKWKNRKDKPMGISWSNENVKCLGVYFGNRQPEKASLDEIYHKMKTSVQFWKRFYFSKFAKARIIEIFISSKLWYVAKFIAIPEKYYKKFQKLFLEFLNHPNKSNLISEDEMFKLRNDGGLKLINIKTKTLASKCKWLLDVLSNHELNINKTLIDELLG